MSTFPDIELGWWRKPGEDARLVWNRSTETLYVIRYAPGPGSVVAFEALVGGCRAEDLPDISVGWGEHGPAYLRTLVVFDRPSPRKVDPPGSGAVD